jgi:hypothetical protein
LAIDKKLAKLKQHTKESKNICKIYTYKEKINKGYNKQMYQMLSRRNVSVYGYVAWLNCKKIFPILECRRSLPKSLTDPIPGEFLDSHRHLLRHILKSVNESIFCSVIHIYQKDFRTTMTLTFPHKLLHKTTSASLNCPPTFP